MTLKRQWYWGSDPALLNGAVNAVVVPGRTLRTRCISQYKDFLKKADTVGRFLIGRGK
jgi:hypothetical protein